MTGGWAKGGEAFVERVREVRKKLNGLRFERSTEGRRTNLGPTRVISTVQIRGTPQE